VHGETIRYYQQLGLLELPTRPAGSVRRDEKDAVERLGFIRRAQDAGFTLKEVAELLRLAERPNCRGARDIAARKLSQVEERMGGSGADSLGVARARAAVRRPRAAVLRDHREPRRWRGHAIGQGSEEPHTRTRMTDHSSHGHGPHAHGHHAH